MFDAINKQFNSAKRNAREEQFILESVMDVEEVLPGSEEDIDDVVDSDSVPDEVYKKVDEMLDKMVDAADYDDTEAEELLDDDDDDISDEELDAVITEAIEGDLSEMDEGAQAEAYKARKAAEKAKQDKTDRERAEHRAAERMGDDEEKVSGARGIHASSKATLHAIDSEFQRGEHVRNASPSGKHADRTTLNNAIDAKERHERRHGAKNENTLEYLRALATGEADAE